MHVVLEYARNALGFQDAQYAVIPTRSRRFIHELALSLAGLAAIDQRRR